MISIGFKMEFLVYVIRVWEPVLHQRDKRVKPFWYIKRAGWSWPFVEYTNLLAGEL